jgi:hypothetical protein
VSAIRGAIAAELARATAEEDRLIAELDQAHARVQQLEELDRQAAQLDDEKGPAPTSPTSVAAPAPPRRQKTSTSAGRRPATPKTQRADVPRGQAHTASGAPAGGRRPPTADDVRGAMEKLGRTSPNAIAKELGFMGGTKGYDAVRALIASLLTEGVVQLDGNIRGRPAYSLTRKAPSTAHANPGSDTLPAPTNPIDRMVNRIHVALEENGPRDRDDLKERVEEDGQGDVFEEDFRLALDRAVTLKRVNRYAQAGRVLYQGIA